MPSRSYQDAAYSKYRYGFNGKENDDDFQDYGMRVYCPDCGVFLSVDPIAREYPELSTYQFASRSPISGVDLDGLEYLNTNKLKNLDKDFVTYIKKQNYKEVEFNGQKYLQMGFHIYQNPQGNLVASSNAKKIDTKITEWVYTDIDNLGLKSDGSNYASYGVYGDCAASVKAQCKMQGTDYNGWNWIGLSPNSSAANNGLYVFNIKNASLSIDYINQELEAGRVVIIGVDYDPRHTAYANKKDKVYNQYGTDHFVVITGRALKDGENVFTFVENATATHERQGGNVIKPDNSLEYISPDWSGGQEGRVTFVKFNKKGK